MPHAKSGDNAKSRMMDFCSEVFTLILQMRSAREFGDPMVLRQRINDLLRRFAGRAKGASFEREPIEAAVFAFVAFVDETVFNSEWSGKNAWLEFPLQMEHYNHFNAGQEFFTRLDEFRQRANLHAEILEVYYMCMVLGFRGKYQLEGPEKIKSLVEDVHHELRRVTGQASGLLSPHGKPRDAVVATVKESVPGWVVGVVAATIGLIFYLIMLFSISNRADDIKGLLERIA
ncbi:MAG: type IVB secretion system protein IcmH/DotU [bacterium]